MEVIILQGIPGSGKSTLAKKLAGNHGRIVSADDYFTDPETLEYNFDSSKLGDAHGQCLRRYAGILDNIHAKRDMGYRTTALIVDNTNTTIEEIAPYYALADAYGFPVKILSVFCPISLAHARCVHGVPERVVKAMAVRIRETVWPKRWRREVVSSASCK